MRKVSIWCISRDRSTKLSRHGLISRDRIDASPGSVFEFWHLSLPFRLLANHSTAISVSHEDDSSGIFSWVSRVLCGSVGERQSHPSRWARFSLPRHLDKVGGPIDLLICTQSNPEVPVTLARIKNLTWVIFLIKFNDIVRVKARVVQLACTDSTWIIVLQASPRADSFKFTNLLSRLLDQVNPLLFVKSWRWPS